MGHCVIIIGQENASEEYVFRDPKTGNVRTGREEMFGSEYAIAIDVHNAPSNE